MARVSLPLTTIAKILGVTRTAVEQGRTSNDGILEVLRQCGEERVAAMIAYVDITGSGGHRHIDPYEFRVTGGQSGRRSSEKLYAYCHEHGETHSFIVSRIFWARKTDRGKVGPYPYIMQIPSRKSQTDMKRRESLEQELEELKQRELQFGGTEYGATEEEFNPRDYGVFPIEPED